MTESEAITIALLMRIYDVQMALLKHFDEPTARRVAEEHGNGGNFNPTMYIPELRVDTDG